MLKQVIGVSSRGSTTVSQTTTMHTHKRRSRLTVWLFLLPALLFQLIWGWYPVVVAFLISFTDAQPLLPSTFTGLESYIRVWNDPLTAQSFRVSFLYTGMNLALTFIIPIIVAIFLMEMPPWAMRWMMLLWFLPISSVASTILWKYLYDTQYGLFEYVATHVFHLTPQAFLNDTNQVLFWLIFPGILLFGPGLIYMSVLQSVPRSYYEAAEVEGAGIWRKIWTITLPRLRPIIAMLLTFGIISSLQEFTWPQIMTAGGPEGASRTVVMYLYSYIQFQHFSDATALSIYLFLIIMTIVIAFRFIVKEDPDA